MINPGKRFEENFMKSVPENYYLKRLNDSTGFGKGNANTRFTSRNECDFIVYANKMLFLLELKSTEGTSFSFQKDSEDKKSKMIKYSQIIGLYKSTNLIGVIPGFLFNLRKTDNTYFLHIKNFYRFFSDTEKSSINEKDIIDFGGILVNSTKLKVNYRYDIESLFNSFVESE